MPPKREAHVTVDTLKNLMSTMTGTVLQQVTEQVKKTMKAGNSARPLPTFDYVPTAECQIIEVTKGERRMDGLKKKIVTSLWGLSPRSPIGLYAICNAFPMYGLVRGVGANLKAPTGSIDRFLKRGPRFLRKECEPAHSKLREEECYTEIAQLRGVQQVLMAEQGSRVMAPTMVFDEREGSHFTSPHNNPLVVELKVASALI
ncbi:hypothetical protein Cgig2_021626 [Carnegiea gigantea]|uniref:Uncharacterized protein n=1 Tax=Carnegiea gigantea TaxID=171969 RepID=A0A9Q1Q6F9_9CARY|nr:hypothetical protein Cgig2_021626 [Carnegiea gigantea]